MQIYDSRSYVCSQAFLPLLGADRTLTGPPGRIIMMSSMSGKMGPPFAGAYAASKHGLEGMSESLRRELMIFGIDVIIVGASGNFVGAFSDFEASTWAHLPRYTPLYTP